MKPIYLLIGLLLILCNNTGHAQNDSIYFWKNGQLLAQRSIKTIDLDSITFSRPTLPFTSGSSNFSKYISFGDSMSAGFCDGALFISGQNYAFPSILSQQFSLVGGGLFTTPLMNDNIGGLLFGGSLIQATRSYFNGSNIISVTGTPTTDITNHLNGPFTNMSVPGAKIYHLLTSGYGNISGFSSGQSNPYFVRFSSSSTTSIIADGLAQNPTFFSLWIGNNDVLSYATTGGTGVNQTGNLNSSTYGPNDITDPTVFANIYNTILTNLTSNGAKGIVSNIPYFNVFPFFTTISTNSIPGLPTSNTNQLNQLFGIINSTLLANGLPARFSTLIADDGNSATVENNPILIFDESLLNISNLLVSAFTPLFDVPTATYLANIYGQARHATNLLSSRDFILFSARSVIGSTQTSALAPYNVIGLTYPMQDNTTITANEAIQILTVTDAYNSSIQTACASRGLAFVDLKTIYNQIYTTGIVMNGQTINSSLITGGMFSVDGIHPTPRGNAFISNKFLEAINLKYGSNLQGVNISNYPVLFPGNL